MKKRLFLLCMLVAGLLVYGWEVMAQTVYVNTTFAASEGWPTVSSYSATVATASQIICSDGVNRDFNYLNTQIKPGNSSPVTINKQNGVTNETGPYIEVLVPNVGEISITAPVGTGRPLGIYALPNGSSTWTLVGTCATDATSWSQSGLSYSTPTTIRICNIGGSAGGGRVLTSLVIKGVSTDNTPPELATITPLSPTNGATGVSTSTGFLTVTFNEKVKAGTGNITVSGATIPIGGCSFTTDQLTLKIPTTSLSLTIGTTYDVTIPSGVVLDLAGNAFAGIDGTSTVWSFSTAASQSSAKEITAINFGPRQIGNAVITSVDETHGTIDVIVQYGTSLSYISGPKVAQINALVATDLNTISVSEFAELPATLPVDFSSPKDIVVTAEDGSTKTWTVTIHQASIDAANLPLSLVGSGTTSWLNIQSTGYASNILNAPSAQKVLGVNYYPAGLTQANQYIIIHWNGEANMASFRLRYGNISSSYEFVVQESANGINWDDITTFSDLSVPNLSTCLGLRSCPVNTDSRYLRWFYKTRSNTTMYVDDIVIEKVNCETVLTPTKDVKVSATNIVLTFNQAAKVSKLDTGITINDGNSIDENSIFFTRDGKMNITTTVATNTNYKINIPAGVIRNFKDVCSGSGGGGYQGMVVEFTTGNDLNDPIEATITPNGTTHIEKQIIGTSIINTQIFTLQGVEVPNTTVGGIYIIKNTYNNGSVKVEKVIVR